MSTMASRITHPEGSNKAPGQEGRTDIGFDNLKVRLLQYPDKDNFARLMTKAAHAVTGSIIENDEIDDVMVEDLFAGGLNQSLEWVSVTFECSGVSRGLTHQLVRTRKASFAQQSMRYADMGNLNVRMPENIAKSNDEFPIDGEKYPLLEDMAGRTWGFHFHQEAAPSDVWGWSIDLAREAYAWMAEHGVPMQDARTVCPIATETYIICNYPLSEFLNLYSYRACQMFYPEMVVLMGLMKTALLEKCPWLDPHIKISCEKTGGGINGLPHKCTYQGMERVEGQCSFEWALEENRVYKSRKVLK